MDTLTQSFAPDDDYHDVHRFDDGTYLVVLLEEVFEDLTSIGGLSNAKSSILGCFINPQEQILQEWSGLDHLPVDPNLDNLLFPTVDYLHWNAVQFDEEGGLLLSLPTETKSCASDPTIGPSIGNWEGRTATSCSRIQGGNGFHVQHDVHDVGNGRILLFDNGIFNNNGYLSRALEIALDTVNFTAQNVWQFAHPSGIYAPAQGSAIRLENGNTLIGWGTAETGQHGTRHGGHPGRTHRI